MVKRIGTRSEGTRFKAPIPNILTASRIVAAPLLAIATLSLSEPWLAFAITIMAALSDALDGMVARMSGNVSDFGSILDPLADKIFVATALTLLIAESALRAGSVWAVLIILSRDLAVSALRNHTRSRGFGGFVSVSAKFKTAVLYGALIALFAARLPLECASFLFQTGNVLLWAAAALSLYTGADYFWQTARKSWK